jgi:hypothetical protein
VHWGDAACSQCGARMGTTSEPAKPRDRLLRFVLYAAVILLLAAVSVGGFAVYHAWRQSQDLAEHYALGSAALQAGDFETALHELGWVVERSPDYEDAQVQLKAAQAAADAASLLSQAQATYDRQEWEQAIALLEELQASDADHQADAVKGLLATAYRNWGLDLVQSEQYAQAVQRFEQSLALAADAEVEQHRRLATLYPQGLAALDGGQYESAIEVLGEVYGLDPEYGDVAGKLYAAYMAACTALRDGGDLEGAEARCLAAHELNPTDGGAAVQLTQVAFQRTPPATTTPEATPMVTRVPSQPTVRPSPTATLIAGPYVGQVATVRVPVADVWPNPLVGGEQKRETQVLMGEQVEITEIRGDWYRVVVLAQPSRKDPRGYPGWVQASDVTLSPYLFDSFIIVMVPSAPLRTLPEIGSSIVAEVSLDTRLNIVDQESPWIQVALPDGDQAWIEQAMVRVEGSGQPPYRALPEDLINTAKSLLGTPYLWGGSSWKALDCSGVVYRTFHAHGILLARDSRDQAEGGQVIAPNGLEPGDLVFYAVGGPSGTVSHVSLYIGSGQAIATYDGQYVSIRRYDDPTYAKEFWGARRYW